jgi:hypothetical protein
MITGTVESQSKKEVKTKFGMKPTWSLKIDGEWYACGFTDPRVSAGDVIAFSFTEGKYGKEIDKGSIMKTGAAPTPAPTYTPTLAAAPKSAAPVSNRPFPIPPLHGDRAIIRQNALNHATKLVVDAGLAVGAGGTVQADETADLIIHVARRFEAYACGDLDVAKAKEIATKKTLEAELGV